jgi:hypothetical protein
MGRRYCKKEKWAFPLSSLLRQDHRCCLTYTLISLRLMKPANILYKSYPSASSSRLLFPVLLFNTFDTVDLVFVNLRS